ncbi:hypothetical protein BC829DRAFT_468451 [Chytridium lagenaria]|nr:hypothetical protein BC829DRAFT_468451 [Chytridium lagenaria]
MSSTTNGYAGSGRSSDIEWRRFGYHRQAAITTTTKEQQQQQQQQKKKNSKALERWDENPVDREYYDLLGVEVLSDPARRSAYNMYGNNANGNSDSVFIDPKNSLSNNSWWPIYGYYRRNLYRKDFRDAMAMMSKDGGADESKPDNMMGPEDRIEVRQARISTLEAKLITKLLVYTESFPYPENGTSPVGATLSTCHGSLDNSGTFMRPRLIEKVYVEEAFGIGSRWMGVVREKALLWVKRLGHLRRRLIFRVVCQVAGDGKKKDGKKKEDAAVGEPGKENGTATKGDGVDAETKKKDATSTDDDEEYQMTAEERELRQKLEADAASKGLEALWRGSKLRWSQC